MSRTKISIASLLVVFLIPVSAGPETTPPSDPYAEVIEALAQGRHWYARRLLSRLDRREADEPAAALLAGRADAGRAAWSQVIRTLDSATWLDAFAFGEGRALLAKGWLQRGRYDRALEHYSAFLGYSIERRPRAMAEIGRALALAELGQPEAAAAAYERAAELLPELAPWLGIRAAESVAPSADTAAVRRYLEVAALIPLWRRSLALAEANYAAGNRASSATQLLRAANSAGGSRAAELRTRAARVFLESGDTTAAKRVLRLAVRSTPASAREAADLLVLLPQLTTSDHLRLARVYERSGYRVHAVNQYREYMAGARLSKTARQRLEMKVGELLFRARWYTAAIDELEALVASGPPRALAARAEYYMARATYRRGLRGGGRARLRDVADRYSGTSAAISSLFLLADVYEGAGNLIAARALYDELARTYPWTRSAGQARFRLGMLAYIDGDHAEARRHFDRCRQAYRVSELRTRATYWAARTRMAEGSERRVAEARRLFRETHARDPFGYYGLLAAERVGIDAWADLAPGPEPAPIDSSTERKFASITLLREAGLDDEAESVLETILAMRPDTPEAMLGLSAALAEQGYGQDAVRFGWRAHARLKGRWSASVLRAIYPLAFTEILVAESRHHQVDPHLLAAVVRQESAFAPDVVSRAGARGLLQIMPPTGRWWARRLGVRDYTDELLFHAETNVHLGAAFLSDLQRRFGQLDLALVAYNAGPTRARRWRRRPDYRLDPEVFTERIPFRETRGYVRGVQTQLRIYRQLYSQFGLPASSD